MARARGSPDANITLIIQLCVWSLRELQAEQQRRGRSASDSVSKDNEGWYTFQTSLKKWTIDPISAYAYAMVWYEQPMSWYLSICTSQKSFNATPSSVTFIILSFPSRSCYPYSHAKYLHNFLFELSWRRVKAIPAGGRCAAHSRRWYLISAHGAYREASRIRPCLASLTATRLLTSSPPPSCTRGSTVPTHPALAPTSSLERTAGM